MKKVFALLLTLTMAMSLLAGCGSKEEAPAEDTTGDTAQEETAGETALSGSVSTNGSTSMEKVIGVLSEQFMADNSGVTVSYDPTGSGTGIEAAKNGTHIVSVGVVHYEPMGLYPGKTSSLDVFNK